MAVDQEVTVPGPSQEEISSKLSLDAGLPADFDITSITKVDFSPEYFQKIMKMFPSSRPSIKKTRRGEDGKVEEVTFTPEKMFAIQAGNQFNAMNPGMGTYAELRDGTSKAFPGKRFSDEQILKAFTTMEDRGLFESAGRRLIENIPTGAAAASTALATKKFVDTLPKATRMRTGFRPVDAGINLATTIYEGGKAIAPFVTGTIAGIWSSDLGQDVGDFVLGEEGTPLPSSYPTMRAGEAIADFAAFSPAALKADVFVPDSLTNYLTNQLSRDLGSEGRDFNFAGILEERLRKQYNKAKKTAKGVQKDIDAGNDPVVNDLFEKGVASVLQGKTAPGTLLRLHGLEQILKKSAKDSRNNLGLFAFYESLALIGAGGGAYLGAEADPMGPGETIGEIGLSIGVPMAFGEIGKTFAKRLYTAGSLANKARKEGFKAVGEDLRAKATDARAQRGFRTIINELEKFGLGEDSDLTELADALQKNAIDKDYKLTSAGASKNPVLLAMEGNLRRQFDFLSQTQQEAYKREVSEAERVVELLYAHENTPIGQEALRAAAELEQIIFEKGISARLSDAETNLFKSVNQLAKSKERNIDELSIQESGNVVARPADLAELDSEDLLDLTQRLQGLTISQQKVARNQQNTLYNEVGNIEVGFFDGDGMPTNQPRFIQAIEDLEIMDNSDLAQDLANLLKFADDTKAKLHQGLGPQIRGANSVKLDTLGDPKSLTTKDPEDASPFVRLPVLSKRRSEALNIARDGTKSASTRRAAGIIAEAIQDDIERFSEFGMNELNTREIRALQRANAFSRAFNDVYTRSFVGDSLKQTRQGDYRLALETIGDFLGPRPDLNSVKIADIEAAGQFAIDNNLEHAQAGVASVHGVIDRILRTARSAAYDPETKTINSSKLQEFINKNERLAESFPQLFDDLSNVQIANDLLSDANIATGAAKKAAEKQVNFTSLLRAPNGEVRTNPTSAIAEAFRPGADQFERLQKLIDVIPKKGKSESRQVYYVTDPRTGFKQTFFDRTKARDYAKTNPEFKQTQETISVDRESAIEGFKSAMFEYFVVGDVRGRGDTRADRPGMNPEAIYNALFERKFLLPKSDRRKSRTGPRSSTVAEFLKNKGIFTANDFDRDGNMYAEIALRELSKAKLGANITDVADMDLAEAKPLLDFAVGVAGSAMGTRSQAILTGGNSGPGSIIAAGKGAEALRNIVLRIPESQKMMFTAELLQDPILLSKMIRQYQKDGFQNQGFINSIGDYIGKKGFTVLRSTGAGLMEDEIEGDFTPPVPQKDTQLKPMRLSPPPNQSQPVGTPTTQAALPAPQPPMTSGAGTNPQVRHQYAALFPNDPISGMLVQQPRTFRRGGIASLME